MKQKDFDQYVKVFLLRKKSDQTEIYKLQADKEVKHSLMMIIQDQYDSRKFQDMGIHHYDPVFTKTDVHHLLDTKKYKSIGSIVNHLVEKAHLNHTTKGIHEKHFTDYMLEFTIEGTVYQAFGSFTSISKMAKCGWFGNLTNDKLKSLDKDGIVGINSRIDTLVIGSEDILIHGIQGFERVFELKKLFATEAAKTLAEPVFQKHIHEDVFSQLKNKIANGGRIARRLSKLRNDKKRLSDFFLNIEKLANIVGNQNHKNIQKFADVDYDKVSKKLFVPEGKEEQLLNVIADGNYLAEVSGHTGYDEGR